MSARRARSRAGSGVSGDPEQRLSAALRAQAAGLGAGSPPSGAAFPPAGAGLTSPTGHPPRQWSAWTVLTLAVLLGALAGGLAGAISAW